MTRTAHARIPETSDIAERVAALDWPAIGTQLDSFGCAVTGPLLAPDECTAISSCYGEEAIYRSRVIMGAACSHRWRRTRRTISPQSPCK